MDEMAWIAETAASRDARNFDSEGRIAFDDGPFSGFIERLPVRPGIALYRVEGVSSHAWQLRAQGDAPAGNLVFGAMLDGAGAIEAKGNQRQSWKGAGRSFVLSLAEREIVYHLEAGKQWRAVTLMLEPDALENLAARNGLPPLIRDALQDGQLPILHMFEINRAVMRAAAKAGVSRSVGDTSTRCAASAAISRAIALRPQRFTRPAGAPGMVRIMSLLIR